MSVLGRGTHLEAGFGGCTHDGRDHEGASSTRLLSVLLVYRHTIHMAQVSPPALLPPVVGHPLCSTTGRPLICTWPATVEGDDGRGGERRGGERRGGDRIPAVQREWLGKGKGVGWMGPESAWVRALPDASSAQRLATIYDDTGTGTDVRWG